MNVTYSVNDSEMSRVLGTIWFRGRIMEEVSSRRDSITRQGPNPCSRVEHQDSNLANHISGLNPRVASQKPPICFGILL